MAGDRVAEPPDVVDVLVVSPPSALWGAQLRLLDYAPELARRGVRLTLGSPPTGDFHAAWLDAGLPHRSLEVPFVAGIRVPETGRRPGVGALLQTGLGAARGAGAVLRAAGDFDAVWSFSLRTHPTVAAACRLRRVPVVVEIVDIVRPGIGRRLLQFSGALADVTIVNSEATAAPLDGRARRLEVIHPGVDARRFHPGPVDPEVRRSLAEPDGVLVGIVGRIDPMKGVHVLVEAASQVPDDYGLRLVVVGDVGVRPDSYAHAVRNRATELLGERARFVGRRGDVPDVLRALDVLVNTSDAEPFGRSVLEAQASGLPVVVNDTGGPAEFVDDGRTGLVVPHDDVGALATALRELTSDAGLRERLGAAARRQAVAGFDIDSRYDRVAALIAEVAAR